MTFMSVYLAVDSATVFCSVSVIKHNQCFAQSKDIGRNHSKQMLNMVDDVLLEANVVLSDIEHFCYVRGPGSFTGVRIAASFLHGLAFGQDKDVIGISSLLTMAYEAKQTHSEHNHFLVALDARMDEVYFAAVDFSKPDWASNLIEQVIAPEQVKWDSSYANAKCIGDGWQYLERFDDVFASITLLECANKPNAQFCAKLVKDCRQNNIEFTHEAYPVYLRDDVTWKQKPKVGS